MILQFSKGNYIDIDSITALRNLPMNDANVVIVGGDKIGVTDEDFEVIEKAYVWAFGDSIYDKDLKRGNN